MSTESTVTDPQAPSTTEDIILSYSNNFAPTSVRNARRNVMAHTRNSSSPASYFNSNSTSYRRVYNPKSLLRESYSENKSLLDKESNGNVKSDDDSETRLLMNSNDMYIEESSTSSSSNFVANSSYGNSSQKRPTLQKSGSISSVSSGSINRRSINRRSSIVSSSSSSIRSSYQFSHIHKKRFSRTIQNISSFIQIVANITPTISFPVTVEKIHTVERLARQIEAEYAFKFGGTEYSGYEPLEVGLLYDVSMISLRFRDLVGDVLEHGDVVNVLNVYESRLEADNVVELDEQEYTPVFDDPPSETRTDKAKRYSMPIINSNIINNNSTNSNDSTKLPNMTSPNISTSSLQSMSQIQKTNQDSETRFQAVLSNILALNYFQQFAIKEYSVENILFWLDVELFAAGDSCEVEDNYFEEQQTSVIHAKYIYYTYISSNAPLQVNISDEVRKDIICPVDDDDIVERSMFDEAQESVYQLMKGYTFIGFEDSPEWEEFSRRKRLDPEEYQSYELTESLENYFHPNMSLMLAVTMAHDPSEQSPESSHYYKEQALHSILSQYFPETVLLDNKGRRREVNNNPEVTILHGYFKDENRLTNAQRMRRMKKEKKLKWVFGETVNGMNDQNISISDETLYDDGRIGNDDDYDTRSILSTVSENRKTAKNVYKKKKKVEKLESIFGRDLRDSQLYSQNIISERTNSLTGLPTSPTESYDGPNLETVNELSAKERTMLWKKTKKLQVVLGETLDEDMVWKTMTRPVIQSTPSNSPNMERFSNNKFKKNDYDDGYSGRSFGSNNGSLTTKKTINRRASDSMIPSQNPESIDTTVSSIVTPPASPVPSEKKFNSRTLKHTIKGVSSVKPENVPLIVVNKDTKEYRRKKLQKLYRFLGEKVPVDIVLGEYDYDLAPSTPVPLSPTSPPPPPPPKGKKRRPNSLTFSKKSPKDDTPSPVISNTIDQTDAPVTKLSAKDKKRHLHRAVKLQKMFGETPPQNLILSQSKLTSDDSSDYSTNSSIDLHRRSIMSLEYLMENDRETMYELIDYIENSEGEEKQNDIENVDQRRNSSPPTPYSNSQLANFASSNLPRNRPRKQTKLKGIRKLSHFFGATYGQMFPDQVLGELLGDLEREIREEAKQNNKLDKAVVAGLMDQLEGLRAKSSELGPDSGDEGGTTEDSAASDDESLNGLRKSLEKNGKSRNHASFESERRLLRK